MSVLGNVFADGSLVLSKTKLANRHHVVLVKDLRPDLANIIMHLRA